MIEPKKSDKHIAPLRIMGILNVTPDSCFDEGKYFQPDKALARANEIIELGADILDVGAESTKPGAIPVSSEEEIARLLPVLKGLKHASISLSIDTYKPEVAKFALDRGFSMINDITGFSHPKMRELAATYDIDICVMHMQKNPQNMQSSPSYPEGIIPHLKAFFSKRIEQLIQSGVKPEKIIIDPGIGFGKTVEHNLEIYRNIAEIKRFFGLRVLLGGSRKSFMGKILGKSYPNLLPATLVMHTIAAIQEVDILRVHDISQHRDLNLLVQSFRSGGISF